MTQDSSICPSEKEITRFASGLGDSDEISMIGTHLDLCQRCRKSVEEYLAQTQALESRLSRLTANELSEAENALHEERSRLPVNLNAWLGDQANRLAEQTALFSTPCRLGQYELHGLIAPGGMGEVYRASHTRLKREVAVKVIRRNQQESQVFYENFLREIETLGQLDHPNMVQAYDALEFDGYLFLVMELLEGQSLKNIASQNEVVQLDHLIQIMIGVGKAVHHLHQNGFLHLDIKPSNIMLLAEGHAKLIDYGLAMPSMDAKQPDMKVFRGTPGFMPPEQESKGVVSESTDLFGTGKVFEFLLDRCLDHGSTRSRSSVLRLLRDLVSEMTHDDPDKRLADAALLLERLQALEQHGPKRMASSRVIPKSFVYGLCALVIVIAISLQISVGFLAPSKILQRERGDERQREQTALVSLADMTNSIGMPLNVVPSGAMSSEMMVVIENQSTISMQNELSLPQPIYMGMCEVTQEQYSQVMGEHRSEYAGETLPVENLSITEAIEFCRRLSETPEEKAAGRVYRLPTFQEWEFACRAGSETDYAFGDSVWQMDSYGWYNGNSGMPQPVGLKRANRWGFYDMHGNVNEYVLFSEQERSQLSKRIEGPCEWGFTGGSWGAEAAHGKCGRLLVPEHPERFHGNGGVGFRVVCDLISIFDSTSIRTSNSLTDENEVMPVGEVHSITIDLRGEPNPMPVKITNAKLFRESDSVHYWTLDQLDEWAEIEYRFSLPSPIQSVIAFEHLAWVYNQNHYPAFDPYAQGTVEVCGDDEIWRVIFHSESGKPILDERVNVLPRLHGSKTVGLRARLFGRRKGKEVYYSQFLRRMDHQEPHQLKFQLASIPEDQEDGSRTDSQ